MELCQMIENGDVTSDDIRFYIGYSGWGEEQLDGELERDMWFMKSSIYVDLMRINPDDLWGEELVKIKPGYKAFSDYAFDPSMN